jgi:hypothetical protein
MTATIRTHCNSFPVRDLDNLSLNWHQVFLSLSHSLAVVNFFLSPSLVHDLTLKKYCETGFRKIALEQGKRKMLQ